MITCQIEPRAYFAYNKSMRQHLGKIILIGIALAGGYLIFSKENTSGYTIPYITVIKKDIADAGVTAVGKAGNFAKNAFIAEAADALEAVSVKTEELIGETVVSVKTQALNFLKGTIDKKVESLAVELGVDLNSGGAPTQASIALNPISFAIKSGTPAYFTIKNRESGSVVYEINWKDGKIDKGQIGKGETKVTMHSWDQPGEYAIKFKIASEKGAREYDVSISIL